MELLTNSLKGRFIMEETKLLEDRQLRNKCVGRFEVLEKVKSVLLMPGTDIMTANQIADYYSSYDKDIVISPDTIRKLYSLHRDELEDDGVVMRSYKDFLTGNDFTLETVKGKAILTHASGYVFEIPNRGVRVFFS